MHIVVCIKEIPDPEIAPSVFRVDEAAGRVVPLAGMPTVISPFDAQAIEAALRVRDAARDPASIRITALCLSAAADTRIMKQALALGADAAVTLSDAAFADSDSYTTALALAHAIRRLADVDLVLAGRQAADTDAGVVGLLIAESLGIPAITLAREVAVADGKVRVVRSLGDLSETVEVSLPVLVSVAHELGSVRKASLRDTMRAAKKPLHAWGVGEIGLDPGAAGGAGARRTLNRLYKPVHDVTCEMVTGEDAAALAAALVRRLTEEKVL